MTDFCSTPLRMIVFPLIVLASLRLGSGSAMKQESNNNNDLDWTESDSSSGGADDRRISSGELYKRLYNFGLGKRAYSYVSEYKRLPVYNFGLGKRSPRHYNFGLGKRGTGDDYDDEFNNDESYDLSSGDAVKRIRPYNFGLGKKRSRQYNFGLGKRANSGRLYSFGIGKRFSPETSSTDDSASSDGEEYSSYLKDLLAAEEGSDLSDYINYNLYNRILGARDSLTPLRSERSLHYNFGLGKRSEEPEVTHQQKSDDQGTSVRGSRSGSSSISSISSKETSK